MSAPLLELNQVTLHIPGMSRAIISNINYQIFSEDFIVILGSNGSGKSSLLKLIDRRYQPTDGHLLLEGTPIRNFPTKTFNRTVKTLTQNCHESLFVNLTVLENYLLVKQQYEPHLLSIRTKKEKEFFSDYLIAYNLNLPTQLDQMVHQLSGGEKQALALALTMLYPPRILLLDEHTSALDPKAAEMILELTHKIVEKHRITCLLTTHDLGQARRVGNRVLALKNGRIYTTIEHDKKSKITTNQLLEACY